jgi:hypothetical protein
MKKNFLIFAGMFLMVIVSCGPQYTAPRTNTGDPINIFITINPNLVDSLNADHIKARTDLAKFMEENLNKSFNKSGYKSRRINFTQEKVDNLPEDSFRVTAKFLKVHFQNKAARFFAGFAAGAAIMNIEYAISDNDGNVIIKKEELITSVKGERQCANALNKMILKDTQEKLEQKYLKN